MYPVCKTVKLACYEKPTKIPHGIVIDKIGMRIGGCKVIYAKTPPCYIARSTVVGFSERCDVETEELKENIVLKLDYGVHVDYLIYPKKVWDEISYRYVEPLSKGDVPKEPGALLHGPPGTGKTSMIDMLSLMLGLHVVDIKPTVLSEYVGRSERMFRQKLDEAEANEPSIVKMDDAEWLVRSRKLSVGEGGAETTVSLTLMTLLLDRIPSWKRRKKRIVAIVATNISPSAIDPALLRSGRLGRKTIFIPLPNVEAVYALMERKGLVEKIGEEEAMDLARKLVNLGANMADVSMFIQEMLDGRKPDLEEVKGRGYVRPVPKTKTRLPVDLLKRVIPPETLESPYTRVHVVMPISVAEPILVHYVTSIGKTLVLLTDERYFDEALWTAETTKSILLVDTEVVSDSAMRLIHKNARVPVIYVGTTGLPVTAFPIMDKSVLGRIKKELLIKTILDYYDITYTDDEIRELKMKGSELDTILESIRYWARGLPLKRILDRI